MDRTAKIALGGRGVLAGHCVKGKRYVRKSAMPKAASMLIDVPCSRASLD
jgi:hypothetical protein